MSDVQATIEELKKQIGMPGTTYQVAIEQGLITQIVDAVGDEDATRPDCGAVAPPWMLVAALFARSEPETRPRVKSPFTRALDGGGEWQFFGQIRVGDTITVETKLADLYARESKRGTMLFEVIETSWVNQRAELVAKNVNTLITY